MSAKLSKMCHFGSSCKKAGCAFRHPEIDITTYHCVPKKLSLEEQKEIDSDISAFMDSVIHSINLNDIVIPIVYTRSNKKKPYVIETHPELGKFVTWDAAYDALLAKKYVTH